MALTYRRKDPDARADAVLELTLQARAILNVHDDTVVSIGEHDCGEPGCCGRRTVVLVLRAGHPTKAIQIRKPIQNVTRVDLSKALAPLAAMARTPKARSRTA
ncbi:MAG: hypothetical protein GEU95_11345 [Rhizobiales bacterium]|nr:hypothetical protein [Hyphomicrobiales bacterium]